MPDPDPIIRFAKDPVGGHVLLKAFFGNLGFGPEEREALMDSFTEFTGADHPRKPRVEQVADAGEGFMDKFAAAAQERIAPEAARRTFQKLEELASDGRRAKVLRSRADDLTAQVAKSREDASWLRRIGATTEREFRMEMKGLDADEVIAHHARRSRKLKSLEMLGDFIAKSDTLSDVLDQSKVMQFLDTAVTKAGSLGRNVMGPVGVILAVKGSIDSLRDELDARDEARAAESDLFEEPELPIEVGER